MAAADSKAPEDWRSPRRCRANRRVCNPNGIVSFSPGLRGTSYPGFPVARVPTPTGLCHVSTAGPQPRSSRSEEALTNLGFRISDFGFFRWSLLTSAATVAAGIVLLLATFAHAQDSQFYFDANGNLLVQTAEISAPPQIIGQPQNQIVVPGESASFFVVAADTRALFYQWRFNGTDIGGATNDAVLLQNVSTNNEGQYSVVLTNPSGSVTSAPALLMIDSDADGLPDSWEQMFFTNLTQNATADFDGDGISNLTEFLDDTNPTNNASALFRLTVLNDGGLVEAVPSQLTYTNGEIVTLTATPFAPDTFHAWTGDAITRTNPITVAMTGNKTVRAHFVPIDLLWTNLAGGDWHVASNWSPHLVPIATDNAIIAHNVTVTLNSAGECLGLTFGPSSTAPTLTGSGTLTVHGASIWTSGTMSGSGRTVIEPSASLTLDNPSLLALTTRTLENAGTVLLTGSDLRLNGAVITNRAGGLFHAQNAASISFLINASRFDNAGIFRKSANAGTTTIFSGVNFNNTGRVEIQTGTLLCNGSFTNNGAVSVSAGATNRFAGGGSGGGTFDATAGTMVDWSAGTFILNAGAQLNGPGLYKISGGTLTANTNLVIENLELSNGTLGGISNVTINNVMNWTGGSMNSGRTIIPAGASLNANLLSAAFLNARTLENGGTVLWTGAGSIVMNSGAVITNRAGGMFHAQNAAAFVANVGVSRFDNAGTFRKSVDIGMLTIPIGMSFHNSGSVEIQAGTLRLAGGGSASGSFIAPTTALVEWTAGTFVLNAGAQLNGTGLYKITGTGIVTGNADLAVENLDLIDGTLDGTGTVTIATAMNWTGGTMSGSGRTVIPAGATLNAAFPIAASLNTRTLENGGTVLWTGAANFGITFGAVVTNRGGALFHVQNAAALAFVSGAGRFDNAGTFRKSGNTGTTTIGSGGNFNNSGTMEIQTGTLLCNGSFNNNGAVNLSAGTTNRLAGGGSAAGAFNAPATALVDWTAGAFTLNAGAQLNGAGLYKINGGTAAANTSLSVENLDLIAGSLDGMGLITLNNVMNWTSGTMGGTGRTIISPSATLNVANPSAVVLNARTLENGGTALWTGGGNIGLLSAVITNRAGALFHVQNAATILSVGGNPRFDNAGTFRKSANTGTTTASSGVSFNNYGTVDIRSGILAANGGYVSSSSALLNCALGGTTAGTNYGQLQVAGTVTLNGLLSVDLTNGFSPALNDSFTALTAGARNGSFANFLYPSNAVTMQLSNTPNSVIVRVTDVLTTIPQPMLLPPELSGSDFKVTWTAVSNTIYRVEFNPDLIPSNWTALPGDVIGISNTATKLDSLTPSNRLYRVRVLP